MSYKALSLSLVLMPGLSSDIDRPGMRSPSIGLRGGNQPRAQNGL